MDRLPIPDYAPPSRRRRRLLWWFVIAVVLFPVLFFIANWILIRAGAFEP
jgi:nitrate reductase NapE component